MTWGTIYSRYLARGHDHGSAAFNADQWEKRQHRSRWKHCPSTHCERRQECASPHDCSASLKHIRAALAETETRDDT
jgi:hypothetical protein